MDDKLKTICRVLGKGLLTGAALYLGWLLILDYFPYSDKGLLLLPWTRWLVMGLISLLTVIACGTILCRGGGRHWIWSFLFGSLLAFAAANDPFSFPVLLYYFSILRRLVFGSAGLTPGGGFCLTYASLYMGLAACALVLFMVVFRLLQKRKPSRSGSEEMEETGRNDRLKTIRGVLVKGLLTGAALYLGWLLILAFLSYCPNWLIEWTMEWGMLFELVLLLGLGLISLLTAVACGTILCRGAARRWIWSFLFGSPLAFAAAKNLFYFPLLRRLVFRSAELTPGCGIAFGFASECIDLAACALVIFMVIYRLMKMVKSVKARGRDALYER